MNNVINKIVERQINSLPLINNVTCTLLKDLSDYKLEGTGVFIKIGSLHLLVSAAHVFDDFNELFIPIDNGNFLIKPGGQLIINNPKTKRSHDKLDIGILILDKISVDDLKNDYSFLAEEDILINHKLDFLNNYIVYGYPSTWSKKSQTRNSFHTRPFINFTKSIRTENLDKDNVLNIFVEYDRKNTVNFKSKKFSYGPNLYGISGCGLWYSNPLDYEKEANPKLVGIMIEWSIKNKKIIFGTRIDAVTEILRHKNLVDFPESDLFSFI
ncbi:MAG: hypothetical protein J6N74_08560 [Chryseobacterium sp.]|nr:hypothetical protein [Chryseobacterium sp.]